MTSQTESTNAARKKRGKGKVSATAKENIVAVFTRIGGTAAMAEWAMNNQTEFYKLYARLVPHEVTGKDGEALIVQVLRLSDADSATG